VTNSDTLVITVGADDSAPCFTEGTLITTSSGEHPVERLQIGATVPTVVGGRNAPIVWIGHRTVNCRRHKDPKSVWPVRIRRRAFGPNRPHADLVLSPDHAVFVDDVLIPVRYLVDGVSIVRERVDKVTYYHLELDTHDVILAHGLPVESFLDTGNRSAFANGGSVVQAHPDFNSLRWEAAGCAPLVVTGEILERVRARLRGAERRRDLDSGRARAEQQTGQSRRQRRRSRSAA
jgi:Hint domain